MSFEKAMNKMKFDVRLLEYNFSQGYISKEDYNKHLAQLEDTSHLIDNSDSDAEEVDEISEEQEDTTENH